MWLGRDCPSLHGVTAMASEIVLVGLIAIVAVLLSCATPGALAEAELQNELQQEWNEFYVVTGTAR